VRRKILIIDDDASVLKCYGALFRRQGYDPFLEADGASAERHLEGYRDVEVVVLDYRMPGTNGLDLLRRLRNRDFRAPAVLVTAFTNREMIQEAKRLGICQVFSKPVETATLLRSVAKILTHPPQKPAQKSEEI